MAREVIDPDLLRELESPQSHTPVSREVSDPDILRQLEAPPDTRSAAEKFATGFSTGATKLVKGVGELAENAMLAHPLTAIPTMAGKMARQKLIPGMEQAVADTFSPERIAAMEEETKRAGGWG